eukprot:CAMPEP_0201517640 /NCGR_PEP_ID=MMETSP0161_2-20130828/8701_1 /ASSEMBLY_ACC=CAM_ASM_000251 /TAXON_ID=180227 /ORGANISM="Neoparamoeba aestuarina, Strain SoJaBio B1-5/56/2" /LENGTH=345 /DNA_ID=CAMNT_0047915197 /DNA_START=65 /DNA_END=1102 /DNA_ORIENTATION=+
MRICNVKNIVTFKTYTVTLENGDKIASLKEKVSEKEGFPVRFIKILGGFHGQELLDDDPIEINDSSSGKCFLVKFKTKEERKRRDCRRERDFREEREKLIEIEGERERHRQPYEEGVSSSSSSTSNSRISKEYKRILKRMEAEEEGKEVEEEKEEEEEKGKKKGKYGKKGENKEEKKGKLGLVSLEIGWAKDLNQTELYGDIRFLEEDGEDQQPSPYAGRVFPFSMLLPSHYPNHAPTFQFLVPVFHPLVNSTGRIEHSYFPYAGEGGRAWGPQKSIAGYIEQIQHLFLHPTQSAQAAATLHDMDEPVLLLCKTKITYNKQAFYEKAFEWADALGGDTMIKGAFD